MKKEKIDVSVTALENWGMGGIQKGREYNYGKL